MKQLLFGDAKVKKHAVDERVNTMQQRDEESQARVATPLGTNSASAKRDDSRRNPSLEARETDTVNQNGFGDEG